MRVARVSFGSRGYGYMVSETPKYGHTRKRYNAEAVKRILGSPHKDTWNEWLRDGIPLPDGTRLKIPFIWLGPRKKEFECEEIERLYQILNTASPTCHPAILQAAYSDYDHDEERDPRRTSSTSTRKDNVTGNAGRASPTHALRLVTTSDERAEDRGRRERERERAA